MYLNSDKIESMFPVAFERTSDPGSNLLSEKNLRKLIKTISTCDSFVLSESVQEGKSFEFVIDGYYVSFLFNAADFTDFDEVYAVIFIDIGNSGYPLLHGFEEAGKFHGVVFSPVVDDSTPPVPTKLTSYQKRYLKILSKSSDQFFIPGESLREVTIDGGEYL